MTPSLPSRLIPLSILVATLALGATVRAQEPAASPSPSPSPSASPAAKDAASEVEATEVDATSTEAARIAAEVERAQVRARREIETALRAAAVNRNALERGARDAAKEMAKVDAVRSTVMAEAARSVAMSETARAEALAEAHVATAHAFAEVDASREEIIREALQDAQTEKREKEREARERERERMQTSREKAREKAQEARERERERAEAAREHQHETESVEDLYEQAMESIDEEDFADALRPLNRLVSLNLRVDAALYWTAYAQGKMQRSASSLAALARLQKEFPASRWAKEGKALEMEVRGKSGQMPRPDQEDDLDLKLMAVSALAQSDPQEAMPMLTKILSSPTASRKVRERSLFVLAQMGSDQASNAIAEVAKGNASPELQRTAIKYLGVFGGQGNRKVLSDVYSSTTDNTIRKQILNSFMVSGDKARVLTLAKTEKDPALRTDAIRLLGIMGGSMELSQMYPTATSTDEKKAILHALFLSGAIEPMATAARGEKDKEARLSAVRNLGLMGRKSETVLSDMYRAETEFDIKKEVLNAFFLQGNSIRLVEIARAEKDLTLKKEAVHWLSLMNSKESRAYMLELLKD